MGIFKSNNDMQWRSTVDTLHYQNTKNYIAEILDAHKDGNYTDNLQQEWSVRIIGWGTEIYNCRCLVEHGAFNGGGYYRNFKKGDIVVCQSKEGQLEDLIILGSIRINGDREKLTEAGFALQPGETINNSSNSPSSSNQVSIHPSRIQKIDAKTTIHNVNNYRGSHEDPSLHSDIVERQSNQGLPGVIQSITKEGVHLTYSTGGIINYTDGNLIFVSNGSKQSKCSAMLEQAQRHAEIAGQLNKMSLFNFENSTKLIKLIEESEIVFEALPEIETSVSPNNGITFTDAETWSIDSSISLTNMIEGGASTESKGLSKQLISSSAIEGREGIEIRSTIFRARKHTELALLYAEAARSCNRDSASNQHIANIISGSVGNHFGTDSKNNSFNPFTPAPQQVTGNVNQDNFSSRSGNFLKPSFRTETAHSSNYAKNEPNSNLPPTKIILGHSVYDQASINKIYRTPNSRVSSHYSVDKSGAITQHVTENFKAFHTRGAINKSIGITIISTPEDPGLTTAQSSSLASLIKYLIEVYEIEVSKVVGQRKVASTDSPKLVWTTEEELTNWIKDNIQ